MSEKFVHPYIPDSVPEVQKKMMEEIGIKSIDELYSDIPDELKFKGKMNIPKGILPEFELKKNIEKTINKNISAKEYLNFMGGGCSQHYVPAICDEINSRSEFLTAYAGEPYEDQGRFQALFEYQSLMAELLDVDVVNVPTFDWSQAASTSIRMSQRITKRNKVLISSLVSPDRLKVIKNYCTPVMEIDFVQHDLTTGLLDLDDLKSKLDNNTASLYFENPSYLGFIETQGEEISEILKSNGSLMVVGCDPISLGILATPSSYGADITCGDIQSLGLHMNYGGATGGFIGTMDKEEFVREYPSRLFGIAKTEVEGELGFGDVLYDDRTSFGNREEGKEYVGTAAALWGITAGVYLSLIGPKGIRELGETIVRKANYAAKKLNMIDGVKAPRFNSPFFKEFVVDLTDTGLKAKFVLDELLKEGIFGGIDLTGNFKDLGETILLCVTETISKDEIDLLAEKLDSIIKNNSGK